MSEQTHAPEPAPDIGARVHHLERSVAALWDEVNAVKENVARNTEITSAIKRDTSELVALFKGAKITGRMVKWAAGVFAAVATAIAAWKGLK